MWSGPSRFVSIRSSTSEIGLRGKEAYLKEHPVDVLLGRLRRARDGVSKRMFRAALRRPWLRSLVAVALPSSARAALRENAKTR